MQVTPVCCERNTNALLCADALYSIWPHGLVPGEANPPPGKISDLDPVGSGQMRIERGPVEAKPFPHPADHDRSHDLVEQVRA